MRGFLIGLDIFSSNLPKIDFSKLDAIDITKLFSINTSHLAHLSFLFCNLYAVRHNRICLSPFFFPFHPVNMFLLLVS